MKAIIVSLLVVSTSAFVSAFSPKIKARLNLSFQLQASRLISSFEPEDFALPSGQWPYTEADMGRLDPADDAKFYDTPRFVKHIDDRACFYLTEYYKEEFETMYEQKKGKLDILDLCSSWISQGSE